VARNHRGGQQGQHAGEHQRDLREHPGHPDPRAGPAGGAPAPATARARPSRRRRRAAARAR
jgi:hypothetical protein